MRKFFLGVIGIGMLAMTACAQQSVAGLPPVPEGATYVAMGSSYASGPGITVSADTPANRCQRSADNYAHQLARKRGLHLVDVSCGGATTAHILGRWGELAPQIDAVTADTRLVTVTIGGNDVGFVSGLMAGSCEGDQSNAPREMAAMCEGLRTFARNNPQMAGQADEAAWAKLEKGLRGIASEVHRRAPKARLIFVDYIRLVPPSQSCAAIPLSDQAAVRMRAIAIRLAQLTAAVADSSGAEVIKASELSQGHDVCARDSWATGFMKPVGTSNFAPYHPNLAAMTAIADALDRKIGR